MRGGKLEYGSWKMSCICVRYFIICFLVSPVMSLPSKLILPPSESYSFNMVRPSVVLPQPDSPTTPIVLPASTAKLTSSTAFKYRVGLPKKFVCMGKYFLSPSTRSIASPLATGVFPLVSAANLPSVAAGAATVSSVAFCTPSPAFAISRSSASRFATVSSATLTVAPSIAAASEFSACATASVTLRAV